jgi:SAM-dependent methyltransferase
MAHRVQQAFIEEVKRKFPAMFAKKRVLDCGSLDINGRNRDYFFDCGYTGVDIAPGKNVHVVSKIHELAYPPEHFDVVISTEMLEHDRFWKQSLDKMVKLLKPGGLIIITAASTARHEHGTIGHSEHTSPLTMQDPEWKSYYKNITDADIRGVIDIESVFASFEFRIAAEGEDIQFWGIKKGELKQSEVI